VKVSKLLKLFYERFTRDETPRLAASTAFYTLFALAPLLLLMIALASFFHVEDKIAFISQIHTLMGPEAAAAVQSIISAVSGRAHLTSWVGLSSALVWAFSASLLFSELRSALTRIFESTPASTASQGIVEDLLSFLRTRLFSLALVFVFTCVAVVSLLVSSTISFMMRDNPVMVIRILNVLISFVVYVVFFTIAYHYVPEVKISFRRALFGALITSVLFVIGKELIGLYLGQTAFGSVYGAAGTLVVMLIWIYYCSLIIFTGAQLTVIIIPDKMKPRKER
jgi:membrane protein